MKRRALVVPVLIVLAAAAVLGYRYRGFIRMKMLDFLHSFDDVPEEDKEETVLPPGRWFYARDGGTGIDTTDSEQIELIRSLGYLSGYEEAPLQMNVTLYDTARAEPGYNVLISGHAPGVTMIDMEGNIVHEWYSDEVSIYGLWPDAQDREIDFDLYRRAYLYPNGDLLAVIYGGGVVRLDRDSNLLWASEFIGAHHDLDVGEDGNIYVIGLDVNINERYNPENFIAEDYLVVLDSLGNTIERISMLDLIADSPWVPALRRSTDRFGVRLDMAGDILHANTVEYIRSDVLPEGYDGPLRPGTILLSLRAVNLVCAVDLSDRSVYWAESDLWHMQHQPTVLPDGSMLVFDNQGLGEASQVLQFDPLTRDIIWQYQGDEENPFYSVGIGSCQRLPGGNTLITESMFGRAFEVTPGGDIVWEYWSPWRAGRNMELIATLHEAFRVGYDYTESWLPAPSAEADETQ
jgi:hypothetical protein